MLHIVLGDGYMPTKELTAQLEDLRAGAYADNDGFWCVVQAKAEPTDTDRALVKWLSNPDYDLYWDAVGDADSADKIYEGAQHIHKATKLAPKIIKMMQEAKDGGGQDEDGNAIPPEGADLLALFFSDEEDASEDRWLNDVVAEVADAGFPVFALNDAMTPIQPDIEEPDEEDEEEEAEEMVTATVTFYTREELSEMELDDLKKIALERGVSVPPRSRKPTYVDAILGEDEEVPEVELETPAPRSTLSVGANTTTTSNVSYINADQVSGPAMIIVVYNGTVTSRVVTAAQAQALISS